MTLRELHGVLFRKLTEAAWWKGGARSSQEQRNKSADNSNSNKKWWGYVIRMERRKCVWAISQRSRTILFNKKDVLNGFRVSSCGSWLNSVCKGAFRCYNISLAKLGVGQGWSFIFIKNESLKRWFGVGIGTAGCLMKNADIHSDSLMVIVQIKH